ncbi:MAG: amino acid aminotransferase [Planctomycetota bacterium]
MFQSAPLNPPDAIFGLNAQFREDPNPEKINLTVGVYQDELGETPVMACVREAEQRLLEQKGSKSYLPIDGAPQYQDGIGKLILGDELFHSDQVFSVSAHTPGGTASLRVAGEMLRRVFGVKKIWMSDPSWANHPKIYESAGLEVERYGYLDHRGTGIDFEKVTKSLESAQSGDAILLHTVCHNPTGVDPSPEQWQKLGQLIRQRDLFPIFDFAYQGFGESLESDAYPIRNFIEAGGEALVCNSFSKNFGLYAERVGGITAVTFGADTAKAIQSQIKSTIRTMYSNPPLHGGSIVSTVLNDPELRQQWVTELEQIRIRIVDLRQRFVDAMQDRMPDHDFSYILRQRGMFSYSGITGEQADILRDEFSIYMLRSGRINIAGMNHSNIGRICDAFTQVLSPVKEA